MSAPIDQHTLAILVAGLERALAYEWRAVPPAAPSDIRAARQAAHTLVAWGQELCMQGGCANCGSTRPVVCPDCDWTLGAVPPDQPLCSICRRRHGPETTHACE
jgi:hypothetical protein